MMNKVRPKKRLGQHFLVDEHYAKRIAELSDQFSTKNILEIGPGMGVLTKYLEKKHKSLQAVEIDPESVAYLRKNLNEVTVIQGDFLRMPINDIGWEELAVIGNFPYNISSQIIFKALENREMITDIAGMFQLEVGQRLAAPPNNKTYGILSVLLQAFYNVEMVFQIPPGAFNPPPKVMSVAVHARRKKDFHLPCNEKLFFKVVKTCFNHRRKTIANNLNKFNIPRTLLLQNQFAKLRAENMSVEAFVELTQFVNGQIEN